MGELILCNNNLAAMPFFLENVSVNIYSLEELIYCMKKYIYLIGTDIQKAEFVSWVKQELGKDELAEKLNISQSYISRIEKKVIKKIKETIKI